MAKRNAKEESIARLVDELTDEYSDVAPVEIVEEELRVEYERLCNESKVVDFIPIFAERHARAHLNARFRPGVRQAAGPSTERSRSLQSDEIAHET
jgi:hypothetical protein